MRARVAATTVIVAGIVMLWGGVASGKGPAGGTISGPGIEQPLAFDVVADGASLVETTGFMYALFAEQPNPMLATQPRGELGPRYTITWELPGPEGTDYVPHSFYPYADGGPLVYTEPGTKFYGTQAAHGGWYRAPARLAETLQRTGLPEPAYAASQARAVAAKPVVERSTTDSGLPWLWIGASLVIVIATIAVVRRVRRRAGTVPPS